MPLPGIASTPGMPLFAGQVALQLEDVLREGVGRLRVAAQRARIVSLVPAGRPAQAEVDPTGYIAASVPNCSAIRSGAWLGSMTPPAPSRIVRVCAPTCAISTLVAEEAMAGMLWCSAYQTRS